MILQLDNWMKNARGDMYAIDFRNMLLMRFCGPGLDVFCTCIYVLATQCHKTTFLPIICLVKEDKTKGMLEPHLNMKLQ